jgi:nicotinamidase-related amidase
MKVWERFLTDDDRRVLATKRVRTYPGLGKNPALLLIDMQVAACGYDKPIYEQLDEYQQSCGVHAWKAIKYQQKVLAAARAAGMQVIYSKHLFRPETGLPQSELSKTNYFSSLNPASEIPKEVSPQKGDIIIEKQRNSCFTQTNLPLILASKKIDSLLLCGNSTSGCVRATVVDAPAYGVTVQVVEEATFDRIEFSHAAALFDMQFKMCDVISTDDALAAIERYRSSVREAAAAK